MPVRHRPARSFAIYAVITALALAGALAGLFATKGEAAARGGPVKGQKNVFTISVSPVSQNIPASGTVTYTVSINPPNTAKIGRIRMTISGLPGKRVTASFSPNPTRSTTTLTITSANARPRNDAGFKVTGHSLDRSAKQRTAVASAQLNIT